MVCMVNLHLSRFGIRQQLQPQQRCRLKLGFPFEESLRRCCCRCRQLAPQKPVTWAFERWVGPVILRGSRPRTRANPRQPSSISSMATLVPLARFLLRTTMVLLGHRHSHLSRLRARRQTLLLQALQGCTRLHQSRRLRQARSQVGC